MSYSDKELAEVCGEARKLAALSRVTERAFAKFESDYGEEAFQLPVIAFGEVGFAVVDGFSEMTAQELRAIFSRIEILLGQPSQLLQDAAATGFLEAVNHREADGQISIHDVAPYLGPESRKYWIAYNAFWGVETPELAG